MGMDGTVLMYDAKKDMGLIQGHDEKKYNFNIKHWANPKFPPERGFIVAFDPAGSVAMKIVVVGRSSTIK